MAVFKTRNGELKNRGMGMGNGESLKRGIFKRGKRISAKAKIQFVTQGTYSSERVETKHGYKPIKTEKADKGSATVILNITDNPFKKA